MMSKPKDKEKQKYMFADDIKFLQKAVVFHPEKRRKFLILKRSAKLHSRPNDWDLPGGNVLFGELHDDSLTDEILEETGLTVRKIKPIQVVTDYVRDKKIYVIFIGYSCIATSDSVTIGEEHSEYRWVTKQEFTNLNPAEYLISLVSCLET